MPASTVTSPSVADSRNAPGSVQSSPATNDGLDKVELSDLDASPPPLPVEQDLMQLARLGELRSIQRLFDSGKFNAKSTDNEGITALHWAAINGHYALCHFLIQSGADVNARGGEAQATPVLWASKRCHLSIVTLLLANGADPLIRDDQGYNLLHSATLDGNIFQLTLLLHQPDIPVDVPDVQGHTSLMWAAYKGYPQCVDILLRWGADVHATDSMGFTALHWALVKGSYACIQRLVEYGSDRFVPSKPTEPGATAGDTPAMTAERMKSTKQWHRALVDSGFSEDGQPLNFPIPGVKDKRWFMNRFFFLWPSLLGGIQLHMLAYMLVWLSIPGVLLVGFGLQRLVQNLLRWAPSDMNHMHRTPYLAGIFAGSLLWVGVQYFTSILPATYATNPYLNAIFASSYGLTAYFYFLAMVEDPGFIPRTSSRGQTKKSIDELVEANAFDETHFCTTCMIRKPLRSKHCKRCMRCVAREDHHCPWIDNCVGVNNHKHFVLYLLFLIVGLITLAFLTLAYLSVLPAPKELHCAIFKDDLCAEWSKDPLTIVTNIWGVLQLSWVFMLLFVHFTQIARAMTTYESMRGSTDAGALTNLMATGSLSREGANLSGSGAGPSPGTPGASGHRHGQSHGRKKEGCLDQWKKLLGLDTFFAIAFNGYRNRNGNQQAADLQRRVKRNPFSRGVVRNCLDFWSDGPIVGKKEKTGRSKLGGEDVDYTSLYEVPRGGNMTYGGYEQVPGVDEAV